MALHKIMDLEMSILLLLDCFYFYRLRFSGKIRSSSFAIVSGVETRQAFNAFLEGYGGGGSRRVVSSSANNKLRGDVTKS